MKNKFNILGIATIIILVVLEISLIVLKNKLEDNNIIKTNDNLIFENNKIDKASKIEDITFDSKKVNVYFFYGEGCPHCKDEFDYLEENYQKYKDYINIYSFEVWNNYENAQLMQKIATKMKEEIDGVPLTIVGDEKLIGFSRAMGPNLDEMIQRQYNKTEHYDIYREISKE